MTDRRGGGVRLYALHVESRNVHRCLTACIVFGVAPGKPIFHHGKCFSVRPGSIGFMSRVALLRKGPYGGAAKKVAEFAQAGMIERLAVLEKAPFQVDEPNGHLCHRDTARACAVKMNVCFMSFTNRILRCAADEGIIEASCHAPGVPNPKRLHRGFAVTVLHSSIAGTVLIAVLPYILR
jgi:hypothetical protein